MSRCTIQKECARGLLARSWIPVGEGPQQCPSITLTPPEISISADIKVTINSPHAAAAVTFSTSQTDVAADLYRAMAAMGSLYLKLISQTQFII